MVIDRGAFLTGDYATVFEEIVEVKEAAGDAHLKVILETGELETYDNVRRASILAMAAGADFIKTSTGKVEPAATMPVTLVMLEAIRDFERATGRQVGMKPAGGIRTAKEAIQYLVILYETLGPRWMTPGLVPVRRLVAAQRRADADRVPADRPLPGPGPLHARLRRTVAPGPGLHGIMSGRPTGEPTRPLHRGRSGRGFWTLLLGLVPGQPLRRHLLDRPAAAGRRADRFAGTGRGRDRCLAAAVARLRAHRRRPGRPPGSPAHDDRWSMAARVRPAGRAHGRGRHRRRDDLAGVHRRVRPRLPRDDVRHGGELDAADGRRRRPRGRGQQPALRGRDHHEPVRRATDRRIPGRDRALGGRSGRPPRATSGRCCAC